VGFETVDFMLGLETSCERFLYPVKNPIRWRSKLTIPPLAGHLE